MNSSNWYLHHPIDMHTRQTLNGQQLSERAAWRASLRTGRPTRPRPARRTRER
ncbi:MAG: hypothetical protein GWN07_39555 [Actinobacteria bacterium]|nr:hypothetical protein [Actinomycetota bacterium]NIS37060.1 hypothetical protein [Actinomycetota bacterium]NIT99073.1 hypothetical protein [Actinomycetota bacterium]NIU71530.1 hypothetical protein [Actinomycetota bacterium]NIV90888.1 hypothetical protein [Actinomycetota bacterium]